jgi:hypothetical protein
MLVGEIQSAAANGPSLVSKSKGVGPSPFRWASVGMPTLAPAKP